MGNKLGRKRQVVDEKYTKPQGLNVHKDVDHKKLRKLILESKLAPCYPGDDDSRCEHEECPICFLYYPSLNRSRCCMKGICTECFLQVKNPNSARPTQCPFCKTTNYAVEYRGVKTKEEKGLEQIEEQRVIEAKIRMRQQEILDDEEKMHQKLEPDASTSNLAQPGIECSTSASTCHRSPFDTEERIPIQFSYKRPAYSATNRDEEFDLDLEDIMVMEAIWLSIQENGKQRILACGDAVSSGQYDSEARYPAPVVPSQPGSSSSRSGGLACAIAALAERQQMNGESSMQSNGHVFPSNMYPGNRSIYQSMDQDSANYITTDDSYHPPSGCHIAFGSRHGAWRATCGSDSSDSIPGYACSDTTEHSLGFSVMPPPPPPSGGLNGSFLHMAGPIVPETYEEQIMLAMAVSLADAREVTAQPTDWH